MRITWDSPNNEDQLIQIVDGLFWFIIGLAWLYAHIMYFLKCTVCIQYAYIYMIIHIYNIQCLYMQRIVSGKKHGPYINVEMHVNIKMSRFVWPGDSQIENQPYGCPFLPTGPCVSSKTGCELCLFWIYERKEHSSSKQPLFKRQQTRMKA
jgi:hypothetical protein